MEKKKTIGQGMGQMSKSLGKWDDEARRDRQVVVARGTRRTTFKDADEEGSASPPSAADRRGRLRAEKEDEDSLVNTVKAFTGKTSETVDKYEEARKKSKINRFFKGVRNIFPKGKKKKKSKGGGADSSDSEGDEASSSSSSKKRYAKTQEEKRKDREIGGGKFQEKERKKREEEERKRQSELEARRKQRRASSAAADEDDEDDESRNNKSSEDEEDERRQMKKQEHLLKRAKSAPSQAQLEKEESSDRPHGIREKVILYNYFMLFIIYLSIFPY
jgi:hypothetical protein